MASQDPRLGKIGGIDTKVCAMTQAPATNGMKRISLGDGWYFRVKTKRAHLVSESFIQEMKALIPSSPKRQSKMESEKVES